LHDLGAISIINSDAQAMGRIAEVIIRTWQLADKMKNKGKIKRGFNQKMIIIELGDIFLNIQSTLQLLMEFLHM